MIDVTAIAAAAFAIVSILLPGWSTLTLARLERCGLVGALAVGLSLVSLIAFLLGLAGAALLVASVALTVLNLTAAVHLLMARSVIRPSGAAVPWIAGGLLLAALALLQGPWLSHTADIFYHLAAIRSVVLKMESFATLPMYAGTGPAPDPTSSGWHIVLAIPIWLFGPEPVAVWRAVHPVAAALPLLALARATWLLSGSARAAVLATVLALGPYAAFDLRTAGYPNQIGLAALWMWFAAITQAPPPRARPVRAVVLALWLAGLTAIHVGIGAAGIAVAVTVFAWRLSQGSWRAALDLVPALISGVAAAALRSLPAVRPGTPIDDRVGQPPYPATLPSITDPALNWLSSIIAAGSFRGRLAAALPPDIQALAVAAALGVLCFWLIRARSRGAPGAPGGWRSAELAPVALLAVLPLAAAIVALFPLTPLLAYVLLRVSLPLTWAQPMLLGSLLHLAIAGRTARTSPLPLGEGKGEGVPGYPARPGRPHPGFLPEGEGTSSGRPGATRAPWKHLATAASVAGVGLLAWSGVRTSLVAVGPRLTPSAHSFASSQQADLERTWRDRLVALRGLPRGTIVVARPETAYYAAGLADVFVTATPPTHTPAAIERRDGWIRRGDTLDAVDLTGDLARVAMLAERSDPALWLVDASSPAWPRWTDAPPPFFITIAGGGDWRLLRYDRDGSASLLAGGPLTPSAPVGGDVLFVRATGVEPLGLEAESGSGGVASPAVDYHASAARPLYLPADLPIGWYRLRGPAAALRTPVGREYEMESFPLRDALPTARAPDGWFLYEQAFHQRRRAAWTRRGGSIARTVQPLPAGRYLVRARVYDYPGSAVDRLEVRAGGGAATLTWGTGEPGVTWVESTLEARAIIDRIEVVAGPAVQPYVVVDVLRLYPADP